MTKTCFCYGAYKLIQKLHLLPHDLSARTTGTLYFKADVATDFNSGTRNPAAMSIPMVWFNGAGLYAIQVI
jgi:hypothetical protein